MEIYNGHTKKYYTQNIYKITIIALLKSFTPDIHAYKLNYYLKLY